MTGSSWIHPYIIDYVDTKKQNLTRPLENLRGWLCIKVRMHVIMQYINTVPMLTNTVSMVSSQWNYIYKQVNLLDEFQYFI